MGRIYASHQRKSNSLPTTKDTASPDEAARAFPRPGAIPSVEESPGRRVDLPEAMREKMESAFGADLSAVKLYESEAVAEAGAKAVTRGSDVSFAPGMLDFTSYGGQALLGHELSHVVSQARGEVTGGGFLNNASLEARADREGAMAAAGQEIGFPSAALSPVSAADAAGPMQAKIDLGKLPQGIGSGMFADFGDAVAEEAEKASSPLPEIPAGSGSGMFADFGDASAEEAEKAESASSSLPEIPAGSGAGMTWDIPGPSRRRAPAPKGKDEWGFSSRPDQGAQFSSGVGFMLGLENASDPKHGKQFTEMMAALKPLAVARGNRAHLDGMAFDAIEGNAFDRAIAGMMAYRKQLKHEWGNFRERRRQIKLLDQMIASARKDKAASEARQTTELNSSEFTGSIRSGQINQVYRYARGGEGGYFKPKAKPTSDDSDSNEQDVMKRAGIRPSEGETDPRLENREVAYSRLGSLLGSSVTIGAKKATLGADAPTGRDFGGKTFLAEGGGSGVLMEEAKGKSWINYNWNYYGLAPGQSGGKPDARAVLVDEERLSGSLGETVGERLRATGAGLTRKSTRDPGFIGGVEADGLNGKGEELDMSDPDYQRQMNEMFLLDTLAGHTDRHAGNYQVGRGEDGRISVKAIDNDLAFGTKGSEAEDAAFFGQRGNSFNYGGLPARMQIDAAMAEKINAMDLDTLKLTFSDLLDEQEIDSLWTRFRMMKDYIASQSEDMLVDEWNEDTARRELSLAGGINSFRREGKADHPYGGNNYYQRQFLMLNAAERGNRPLYHGAIGYHVRF